MRHPGSRLRLSRTHYPGICNGSGQRLWRFLDGGMYYLLRLEL